MNALRTRAVAVKVLRSLRRDKRSLALMLVAPMLAMAIFGFVFGVEVGNVPVVVVNEDEGDLADDVVAALDPERVVVTRASDLAAARAGVEDGTYRALMHFPANFTADATPTPGTPPQPGVGGVGGQPGSPPAPPKGTSIGVAVDGSNSQMVAAAMGALRDALESAMEERGGSAPVSVESSYVAAEGAEYIDFFVPGIMAFAVLMFTTLLTLLAFVQERTSGTLSRLLVTPVSESDIVLGYALAFSLIGVVQGLILLGVAVFVFDVLIVGSVALVVVIVALMAVDALSLGILLSAAAKRESQAVQFLPLVIFPTFLLSGIFLPPESLPGWLKPFAWAIPPTYAVEALRDVMLRGWGIAEVWWHVAALAGFAIAFLGLAVLGLRRARVGGG